MFMALLKRRFGQYAVERIYRGRLGLCQENGISAGNSVTRTVLAGCFMELRGNPAIPGLFVRNEFPALKL